MSHRPAAKSPLASPTYFEMSARTSLETRVGSDWYSAWIRSGALPAFFAVITLVRISAPLPCFDTVTVMSGFFLFQIAATFSMFGAHDQ